MLPVGQIQSWSLDLPAYRLAYIVDGKRIIGYDNERGKGDHRHYRGTETPYELVSIDQLLADFVAAVEEERRSS